MSFFGIEGYRPQWLCGQREIAAAHGRRLNTLVGRRLRRAWLVWDMDADGWFADCPVLFDFDGVQVEVVHWKVDELSITWDTIDPTGRPVWSEGEDDDPNFPALHLGWRHDVRPELEALHGQRLQSVELLERIGPRRAKPSTSPFEGPLGVGFSFAGDQVRVVNAFDENGLEFGWPGPEWRRHSLDGDS